jgi:hypothetical protein
MTQWSVRWQGPADGVSTNRTSITEACIANVAAADEWHKAVKRSSLIPGLTIRANPWSESMAASELLTHRGGRSSSATDPVNTVNEVITISGTELTAAPAFDDLSLRLGPFAPPCPG